MNIENFADELVYNIQIDFWNLEILEPGEFVQRLVCFPYNGVEERIIGLIREAVHQFQNQRAILKYIYIIDKLIKVPGFLPAIHTSIIDIYSDIFVFLLMQRCIAQIEELKILRKFWVGKLHPYYLSQIKENIIQKTGVDIDSGFKQEMINRIRNYYSTKLNMTPQQMAYHLPLLGKSEQQIPKINVSNQTNQRYVVDVASIYPVEPVMRYPQPNSYINYPAYNNQAYASNLYTQYYPSNPHCSLPFSTSNINMIKQQPYTEMMPNEDYKRKRLASQQTRVAISGSVQEGVQPNPRKIHIRNQVIIDYKYMLSKLKRMNPFGCKECGLQFMSNQILQAHRSDHLKEKLTKNDKNLRQGKNGKLCSIQEWLNDKQDLTFSLDKFYISIPKQEIQERLCDFCSAPLDVDFRNNRWIYTNAATVQINSKLATIHKSCQLALETTYERDPL